MSLSRSRKVRAAETQRVVARFLQEHGYPSATAVGSGEAGVDIRNTEGIAVECKARRDWSPISWLRQAERNAGNGDLAVVVARPDGFGPTTIHNWPTILRLSDAVALFNKVEVLERVLDELACDSDHEHIQSFVVEALAAIKAGDR